MADTISPANPEFAARLLGAAESLAAATGLQLSPADPELHQNLMASVRGTLGAEAFDAALRAGARFSVDEAIDMGLTAP
ncbi:hypothetical protein D3C83_207810 [compost metagenome]